VIDGLLASPEAVHRTRPAMILAWCSKMTLFCLRKSHQC
jgi:hypothetical protein